MASRLALADAPYTAQQRRAERALRPVPPVGTRRVGRPRGSNSDARRQMIVSAGIQVFAARGYDAATLKEVADLVDVTRPAVHHYFAGKAPLYQAALERAREIVLANWSGSTTGLLDGRTCDDEVRFACALLGTSLAQSRRLAEIAPLITEIADEVRQLCRSATAGASPDSSTEILTATIIGQWVLTAAALPQLDPAGS
ncbi:helix-turn-helix domain-containing protein [Mycobacterium sp. M26]|uniref:TetR/AcrR family transcriptional regulator n=1 Tax=Mycobacterium sp. M26 TaxID=1762962 RepID=UPI00073E9216|nr:helix-turn-helix domain-containing protein [Mycobacterium sp. M26]